ncbi:MAG: hypothetical protein COB59_00145 [Rhodospirillaceae bacterium]|nr:MAG: hypothetical protein COB59_00145 [Rhodospirillaceae bacterium]
MADDVVNLLFVSAGNSSRSIMAEALLEKLGRNGFKAYSAGSKPVGSINALTLETLKQTGYDTSALRSKSWNEFATIQAPRVDAVITLDDGQINDRFPIWFSDPVIVRWDFAKVDGTQTDATERQYAYRRLFGEMEQQILRLTGQDLAKVRGADLESRLKKISP